MFTPVPSIVYGGNFLIKTKWDYQILYDRCFIFNIKALHLSMTLQESETRIEKHTRFPKLAETLALYIMEKYHISCLFKRLIFIYCQLTFSDTFKDDDLKEILTVLPSLVLFLYEKVFNSGLESTDEAALTDDATSTDDATRDFDFTPVRVTL